MQFPVQDDYVHPDAGDTGEGKEEGTSDSAAEPNKDGEDKKPKNQQIARRVPRIKKNTVLRRLRYEFAGHGGIFRVSTVYNQNYVIDVVDIGMSTIRRLVKIGELSYEPKGSYTAFNTKQLLTLIEDMMMTSLLL